VDGHAPRTVGEVARLAGISVRALHHYDEIGLVTPSSRTRAGYRAYADADVERLHQVLVYRELGFTLEQIARVLDDPSADPLEHLQRQRALLEDRIDQLHHMVASIEKMMEAKAMGIQLTPEEQKEIFGQDWQGEEYAAEAEERWGGTDAWKQSQERAAKFTKEDWKRIKAEGDAFGQALAQAMRDGVEPGSERANELAEQHRHGIETFYDCGYEMQVNLAEMYVADPRFSAYYDKFAEGLAVYVRDIIVANAIEKS
jgi:DNA-binding transcriptional MerR regulator